MNQLERFNPMFLNILLPVYNEEKRLQHGVIGTIDYLQSIGFSDYIVTIVDNGSTDKTSVIAKELEKTYDNVNYLQLSEKADG
jgi:glycosyltransferase involved in cell wall biosynthesis